MGQENWGFGEAYWWPAGNSMVLPETIAPCPTWLSMMELVGAVESTCVVVGFCDVSRVDTLSFDTDVSADDGSD